MKKIKCYLTWLFIPAFVALSVSVVSLNVLAPPTLTLGSDVVGWCNLDSPPQVTLHQGELFDVFGQVFKSYITDGDGQGSGIYAQAGIGAHGTMPDTDPSWTWFDADYTGDNKGNDVYAKSLQASLAPGIYDYCYRFNIEGGDWTYGDIDGSDNGYSPDMAGILTILGSTPTPTPTLTPTPTGTPTPTPGPTPVGFIHGRISDNKDDIGIAGVRILLFKDEKPQGGDGNIFSEDLVTSTTSTSGGQGGEFTFTVYPPSSSGDKFLVAVDRITLPIPLYMDVLEKGILPAQVNQASPVPFKVTDITTGSYLDQIIAHILVAQDSKVSGAQYDQYLDVNFDFGNDVADVIKLLKAFIPTPTPTPKGQK